MSILSANTYLENCLKEDLEELGWRYLTHRLQDNNTGVAITAEPISNEGFEKSAGGLPRRAMFRIDGYLLQTRADWSQLLLKPYRPAQNDPHRIRQLKAMLKYNLAKSKEDKKDKKPGRGNGLPTRRK